MISEKKLRMAAHAELSRVVPPPSVWERVKQGIPAQPSGRRLSPLTAVTVSGLVVLMGGVAAAATPQVQAMMDKYFHKTGIKLVEVSPQVMARAPVQSGAIDPSQLDKIVPEGMKLPSYLPVSVKSADMKTFFHRNTKALTFSVQWYGTGGPEAPYIALTRYDAPFDGEGTFGPVQEVKDVKVGQADTSAYKDNLGWHILWTVDGFEYHLQATNLPLDEAVKVAASLE